MGILKKAAAVYTLGGSVVAEKALQKHREAVDARLTPEEREAKAAKEEADRADEAAKHEAKVAREAEKRDAKAAKEAAKPVAKLGMTSVKGGDEVRVWPDRVQWNHHKGFKQISDVFMFSETRVTASVDTAGAFKGRGLALGLLGAKDKRELYLMIETGDGRGGAIELQPTSGKQARDVAAKINAFSRLARNEGEEEIAVSGAVQPTASVPEQIKALAELHDSGILTDEEFLAKKTELLAKM